MLATTRIAKAPTGSLMVSFSLSFLCEGDNGAVGMVDSLVSEVGAGLADAVLKVVTAGSGTGRVVGIADESIDAEAEISMNGVSTPVIDMPMSCV